MEASTNLIEPLLERFKDYGKTSFELIKLKSIDKTADVAATIITRLCFVVTLVIFLITLNIAAALWIGDMMGKSYEGFLIVAGFYAIVGIVIYFMQPSIKAKVLDSVIKLMIN